MFTNKKSILFITKSKIKLSTVVIDNKSKENAIEELNWTSQTLESVLLRLQKHIGDNARILLSEDFVYVVHISFPIGTVITRDIVREKAQELIPENLKETVWDFKEIAKSPSIVKSPITVQVVTVVRSLFEELSESIVKLGLHIEAIEPVSYALARFTKKQDKPFLLIYIDEEILLVLAEKETVIATQRLYSVSINDINQFIAFAKEKFSIDPKNIIFCGNTKSIDLRQFQTASLKAEIQNISPAISLAYKEDLKGKDEDVLNLGLLKILHAPPIHAPNNIHNKAPKSKKLFPNTLVILSGFVITVGIIGGLTAYKNIYSKQTALTPTSAPTLTPTLMPIQQPKINKSEYTISILNGSNKAGEAAKAKKLLEENGFNVINTGNAERGYEKTEVRFRETIPSELISSLDKALKTSYNFSVGKKLEETEVSDILVIIGKE